MDQSQAATIVLAMNQSQAANSVPAIDQPKAATILSAMDQSQAATNSVQAMDQSQAAASEYNTENILFDIILLHDRVQGLMHLNVQNDLRPTLGVIG